MTSNRPTNYTRKAYQDLTFTDDYMFCRILENDPEICRQLLELILDKDIRKVELADAQHSLSITSDIHSVRFDVFVNDDAGTVFDIEIQTTNTREIPRRSRYYQGIIDIDHLSTGMSYRELPDSYVIFICTFDLFGEGRAKYVFKELCTDDPMLELGSGTYKVYVNALGKRDELTVDMLALLNYLCGEEPTSDLTREIEDKVIEAKSNKRWEREYVLFEEKLREAREAGLAEGRIEGREAGLAEGRIEGLAEGQDKMVLLFKYCKDRGALDKYEKAMEDPEYLKELLKEMGA